MLCYEFDTHLLTFKIWNIKHQRIHTGNLLDGGEQTSISTVNFAVYNRRWGKVFVPSETEHWTAWMNGTLGWKGHRLRVLLEEWATLPRNGLKFSLVHTCMRVLTVWHPLPFFDIVQKLSPDIGDMLLDFPVSRTVWSKSLFFLDNYSYVFSMSVYWEKGYILLITTHRGRGPGRASLQCLKYHHILSCHKINNPQRLLKNMTEMKSWAIRSDDSNLILIRCPKHTSISFVKSFKLPKLWFVYLSNLGRTRTFP